MVRPYHKLARINEAWMLNLGKRKVKQDTPAPQKFFILPNTEA